jgi:hypothetical protein
MKSSLAKVFCTLFHFVGERMRRRDVALTRRADGRYQVRSGQGRCIYVICLLLTFPAYFLTDKFHLPKMRKGFYKRFIIDILLLFILAWQNTILTLK